MRILSFLPTLRGLPQTEEPRNYYFVRREGGYMYQGKTIEAFFPTCGRPRLWGPFCGVLDARMILEIVAPVLIGIIEALSRRLGSIPL